jgi:hypothetical protein
MPHSGNDVAPLALKGTGKNLAAYIYTDKDADLRNQPIEKAGVRLCGMIGA